MNSYLVDLGMSTSDLSIFVTYFLRIANPFVSRNDTDGKESKG